MSESVHGGSVCLVLATLTCPSSHFKAVTKNNNLIVKSILHIDPTNHSIMSVKQQLNNRLSTVIQMWMFTGACFCPYTKTAMCSPLLTSLPVLYPFLFPWHQLWQTGWDCCGVSACLHLLCRPSAPVQQAQTGRQMAAPLTSEQRATGLSTYFNKTAGALLEQWQQCEQIKDFTFYLIISQLLD